MMIILTVLVTETIDPNFKKFGERQTSSFHTVTLFLRC
jgi:hypothetical protein